MVIQSIKGLLGEELAQKVEEALKGKGKDGKDIDLVVGNDGSFVPAEKYSGLQTQASAAENALKQAAEALKAVGGSGDPAKLGEDVKTAQNAMSTLEANYKNEMAALQKTTGVKMALAGLVHDPADILSLLDMEKVKLGKTGELETELEEMLKPIRESKPYLFKEKPKAEGDVQLKGAKPGDMGQPAGEDDKPAGPTIF